MDEVYWKGVGKRLREARLNAGYNQTELAKVAHATSAAFISWIEKGKRRLAEDKAAEMCKVLGIETAYLFNRVRYSKTQMISLEGLTPKQVRKVHDYIKFLKSSP